MNREQIVAKVKEVTLLANKEFNVNMPVPQVRFFAKGRVAGRAYYGEHLVEFNETLAKHNPEKFYQTVIHEVAHLVTFKVFPRAKQAHGPEFKLVDVRLGGRGTRGNTYDVSVSKVKKTYVRYVCKCACQEHYVTKKVADKAGRYRCRTCRASLAYTGETKKVSN